jgi:hypothetical protein
LRHSAQRDRNVDQGPVIKIGARQLGGDHPALLVDVGGDRRCIDVAAKQDQRLGAVGHVVPGQVGIAVAGKTQVAGRIDDGERALGRDELAVAEGITPQFHRHLLLP